MSPSTSPGEAGSSEPRIDPAAIVRLQQGEDEAWRRFLLEYHGIFVRAVRIASWRVFRGSAVTRRVSLEELTDDAKVYFYRAFLRSFRRYEDEVRFRAYLFRTVQNFLMERFRIRSHELLLPADDLAWADRTIAETSASPTAIASEGLYRCIDRLTHLYRSVVLLRIECPDRALTSLADVFGVSVDAIHKRYQRALTLLKECLEQRSEHRDDV